MKDQNVSKCCLSYRNCLFRGLFADISAAPECATLALFFLALFLIPYFATTTFLYVVPDSTVSVPVSGLIHFRVHWCLKCVGAVNRLVDQQKRRHSVGPARKVLLDRLYRLRSGTSWSSEYRRVWNGWSWQRTSERPSSRWRSTACRRTTTSGLEPPTSSESPSRPCRQWLGKKKVLISPFLFLTFQKLCLTMSDANRVKFTTHFPYKMATSTAVDRTKTGLFSQTDEIAYRKFFNF